MGLRDRLKRLQREARSDIIAIPQPDGPPAKFPASDLEAAFLSNAERLRRGDDTPPHPLAVAAAHSTDPKWRDTFFGSFELDEPVEDLSE